MKKTLTHHRTTARTASLFALGVLIATAVATTGFAEQAVGAGIPVDKDAPGHIIVFKPGVKARAAAEVLEAAHGLHFARVYEHALQGAFVPTDLPDQALEALLRNPNIAYIEKNGVVSLAAQPIPTGIDRVDGECAVTINGSSEFVDVDIAIIDTGIDPDHPDLNVDHSMSVGFTITTEGKGKRQRQIITESHEVSAWEDRNGHGTHVAGTAAAIDNGIGVVGVAPGARLASVRYINYDVFGGGSTAYVIAAMDYVAAHADTFEVANISLQFARSEAANDAVAGMTAAGVVVVVCAGNYSEDASGWSPASAPSAITVSALTDSDGLPGGLGPEIFSNDGTSRGADDTLAPFSNFGEAIDVAAPGVAIYSTHLNGGYAIYSGTSMASPHVAGAAALHIARHGGDRDGDGVVDGTDVALMEALVKSTGWQPGDPEYFGNDPDEFPEPLLNVPSLVDHQIDCFPTVTITSPADGSVDSGTIMLQADASDDYAIAQLEFFVGGVSVGVDSDGSDGYSVSWNSNLVSDATYEISAVATDDASQASSTSIFVTVDNDDDAPVADAGPDQTVQDADATGTELVTLDASASSDDRGISSYEWWDGSTLIATDVSPTVEFLVGAHTMTLIVTDSIGQTAQDSVVITVEEALPAGSQVSVASLSISGYGGRNGNNHLQASAVIQDDLGAAVAGAVVEADLYRDGGLFASSTSPTDASGVALLFDEKSIAAGSYTVVITGVTAANRTFDGVTPSASYTK